MISARCSRVTYPATRYCNVTRHMLIAMLSRSVQCAQGGDVGLRVVPGFLVTPGIYLVSILYRTFHTFPCLNRVPLHSFRDGEIEETYDCII